MSDQVTVVVRHRIRGGERRTTRLSFPIPENMDPENGDSFLAAMVHHTAAVHAEQHFGEPDPRFLSALRIQVITGILERAAQGPHRLLAERVLRVLRLKDRQLLEQHASGPRGENVG